MLLALARALLKMFVKKDTAITSTRHFLMIENRLIEAIFYKDNFKAVFMISRNTCLYAARAIKCCLIYWNSGQNKEIFESNIRTS